MVNASDIYHRTRLKLILQRVMGKWFMSLSGVEDTMVAIETASANFPRKHTESKDMAKAAHFGQGHNIRPNLVNCAYVYTGLEI